MADRYDLVIVGMGSGGLVSAEFAVSLGLKVAVVERARVGGDCLWTGCVPSKALLASAKAAATMRHGDRYGLPSYEPAIDTALVWQHIKAIQQDIAVSDDDPARYTQMGAEVVFGTATVAGPNQVDVALLDGGHRQLDTRVILLCTGSRPAEPEVPGLHEAGFLTSESIFEIAQPPSSIVLIGGGPIGIEMAQAFNRLGIATTVLQKGHGILLRDEPALVAMLQQQLVAEGVDLQLGVEIDEVTVEGDRKVVHARRGDERLSFAAEGILVAVGRRPNVEGLGLEALGIELGPKGVKVDDRGRTSVRSIYVAGDAAGRYLFTHSAAYEAVKAVRDAFFPGKGTLSDLIPWCTFTDPELAHAGLTIAEAEARFGDDVDVWRMDLTHSDRARADRATNGAVIVVTAKGKVVGAHILAPSAGEMIHELALAIRQEMKLADVASLVHVYPTLSTSIGQLASESVFEKAAKLRWLVRKAR